MSNQQWDGHSGEQGPQAGAGQGSYQPGPPSFPPPGQPGQPSFPPPAQPGQPQCSGDPNQYSGDPNQRSGGVAKMALIVGGALTLVVGLAVAALYALGFVTAPWGSQGNAGSPNTPAREVTMADIPMPERIGIWEYLPVTDRQSWYTADQVVFGPVLVMLEDGDLEVELFDATFDSISERADGSIICGIFESEAQFCYVRTAEGQWLGLNTADSESPPPDEFQTLVDGLHAAIG